MMIVRLVVPAVVASLLATGSVVATRGARVPAASVAVADSTTTLDPIARLQRRIDAGEALLPHDSARGYLPALLRALEIPVSSQGLVFSRTSLQTDKIAPWAPRALYFNDDVYVGYVPESHFLEIASMHPTKGAVFYTLDQGRVERPSFNREGMQCLMCHQSRATTEGVPGLMVLSTIADRLGYPIAQVENGPITDATPLARRYGGWYVTGTHGTAGHAGNVRSPRLSHEVDKQQVRTTFPLTTESHRTDLAGYFDGTPYPTSHSDLVALMVLVHQSVLHNLITLVHDAAHEAIRLDPALAEPGLPATTPTPQKLRFAATRLVRALFFDDEAPLAGPVAGTSSFADDFQRRGPRDAAGRSLRDLDLQRRLFKYPLSFLIYSDGIEELPVIAKREVFGPIAAILRGDGPSPLERALPPDERQALLEIIRETKPDILKRW
jgi:hypothetical protein